MLDPEWDDEVIHPHDHVFENGWSQKSIRTGLLGVKLGMISDWDKWGVRFPLTVLQVQDCQVTKIDLQEDDFTSRIQVGCTDFKPAPHGARNATRKSELKFFESIGVPPKKTLRSFRITKDSVLPVGTRLDAQHFIPGQYVDVQGVSKGKGYQGGMKLHGWKGGPASHGATKSHRKMGATGGATNPGRVLPGKTMAGRMGNETRWVRSLWVYKINTKYNLLFVKGSVPGNNGRVIKIMDAVRYRPKEPILPFPTFVREEGIEYEEELLAKRPDVDVLSPEFRRSAFVSRP